MIIYDIISSICFLLIFVHSVGTVWALARMDRKRRVNFVKNFKKGRFFIVYIIAIPLFVMGLYYAKPNDGIIKNLFVAINKTVNLVVLKYEVAPFDMLIGDSFIYRITLFFTYFVVLINALMFTLSIIGRYAWLVVENLKFNLKAGKRVYIFGANEGNYQLYKTCDVEKKVILWADDKEARENMYESAIVYNTDSTTSNIQRMIRFAKDDKVIVIINTGSDDKNVTLCKRIIDELKIIMDGLKKIQDEREKKAARRREKALKEAKEKGLEEVQIEEIQEDPPKEANCLKNLAVYVFGDPMLLSVYDDVVEGGYGCIRLVTKYQQIAYDFIDEYPFARFMSGRHIDYRKATVKKGVNINTVFVGFGKTARQIFLTSVANNQFICEENGEIKLKKVNYYMFDKNQKVLDKDLNHSYYRYEEEFKNKKQEKYLEFPDKASETKYYDYDMNDKRLYGELKKIFTRSEKDVNFLVIAYGTDLENIDFAQKMIEKAREWKAVNLNIFVKSRRIKKQETFIEQDHCYFIGNEAYTIYNFNKLTDGKIYELAQMRNYSYDLEKQFGKTELTAEQLKRMEEDASSWFEKTNLKRYSNLFCGLSLRQKLNLIGYDCVDKNAPGEAVSEEDFIQKYSYGYPIKYGTAKVIDGKKQIICDYEFTPSLRTNLATLEHYRWNSFMLSHGFVPPLKKLIYTERDKNGKYTDGKDYSIRQHSNLTTIKGLKEYAKIVSDRDGKSWKEVDVFKYDYQIMDDCYWLLSKVDRKIVKKIPLVKESRKKAGK